MTEDSFNNDEVKFGRYYLGEFIIPLPKMIDKEHYDQLVSEKLSYLKPAGKPYPEWKATKRKTKFVNLIKK